MTVCRYEECDRPIAPNDGEFCISHSKKLATPSAPKERLAELRDKNEKKSVKVAAKGINTSADFANFMGALMSDIVEGKIEPDAASAACKAGDALLRVVEMRLRYGFKKEALQLTDSADGIADPPDIPLDAGRVKRQ